MLIWKYSVACSLSPVSVLSHARSVAPCRVQFWNVPRHGKDRLQQARGRHFARDDADVRSGRRRSGLVPMLEEGHYELFRVINKDTPKKNRG